jgi:hypothetical protein
MYWDAVRNDGENGQINESDTCLVRDADLLDRDISDTDQQQGAT